MAIRVSPAFALLCLIGCPAEPPEKPPYPRAPIDPNGPVVGRAGAVELTGGEVLKRIDAQGPFLKGRYKDPDRRIELVDQELRFELLAQDAWANGFANNPEVVKELKKRMVQEYLRTKLDPRIAEQPIGEGELLAEFNAHQDEFNKPEMVRVAEIGLEKQGDGKAQLAELERLKQEIEKVPADRRATSWGERLRARSGSSDRDFLPQPELAAVYGAALAKQIFDAPVEGLVLGATDEKVVLLFVTGRKKAIARTLDQVKPQIRANLVQKKRAAALDALIGALKTQYGFDLDTEAVRGLEVKTEKP